MLNRLAVITAAIFACASLANAQDNAPPPAPVVETLAFGLYFPWSMAFTPNGDILIVEKRGGLRVYRDGALLPDRLAGGPEGVFVHEDSGLHDVVLSPDFAKNGEIFIAFAEGNEDANHLAVWRGRLAKDRLTAGRVIFRATPDKRGAGHPGGRMAFLPDKTLLVTVGDGYDYRAEAQNLQSDLGKIVRIDRNGHFPPDNPFVTRSDARKEIWSYGHRNAQGLAIDPATGDIWEHEHGPRGGDEVNLLAKGSNYGWPLTTNGIDYSGELISERAHAPGIVSPKLVWAPSIAPSGLAIYRGVKFPEWNGHFLIGGLASRSLIRTERNEKGGFLVERDRLLSDLHARIRDVRVGPDGYVYLLTDEETGRLLRLRPATPKG